MRFRLYALAALFAIAASVTHVLAIYYSLYWSLEWFDFIVHALAGGMVGLVSYLVASWVFAHRFAMPAACLLLIGVGIAWEVFELVMQMSIIEPGFVSDTLQDLLADIIGGGFGIWLSHRLLDPDRLR